MTNTNHAAEAELIRLGYALIAGFYKETDAIIELEASGEIDDDDKLDAAVAPLSAVINQINQHDAQTPEGLHILDLADRWVNGSLPQDFKRMMAARDASSFVHMHPQTILRDGALVNSGNKRCSTQRMTN
jgi:hypothetical protein